MTPSAGCYRVGAVHKLKRLRIVGLVRLRRLGFEALWAFESWRLRGLGFDGLWALG